MSRRRAPAHPALAVWGLFLAVLTAVAVVFFSPDVSTPALLGGAAAFVLVLALLLAIGRRSLQGEGDGADPDASPATVWLVLSLVLAAVGAALGLWLALIGGGMAAVGVAAVARELRAQRAAEREALGALATRREGGPPAAPRGAASPKVGAAAARPEGAAAREVGAPAARPGGATAREIAAAREPGAASEVDAPREPAALREPEAPR